MVVLSGLASAGITLSFYLTLSKGERGLRFREPVSSGDVLLPLLLHVCEQ
jgi:hypothetical protein